MAAIAPDFVKSMIISIRQFRSPKISNGECWGCGHGGLFLGDSAHMFRFMNVVYLHPICRNHLCEGHGVSIYKCVYPLEW
jgi:hypothetical protein